MTAYGQIKLKQFRIEMLPCVFYGGALVFYRDCYYFIIGQCFKLS